MQQVGCPSCWVKLRGVDEVNCYFPDVFALLLFLLNETAGELVSARVHVDWSVILYLHRIKFKLQPRFFDLFLFLLLLHLLFSTSDCIKTDRFDSSVGLVDLLPLVLRSPCITDLELKIGRILFDWPQPLSQIRSARLISCISNLQCIDLLDDRRELLHKNVRLLKLPLALLNLPRQLLPLEVRDLCQQRLRVIFPDRVSQCLFRLLLPPLPRYVLGLNADHIIDLWFELLGPRTLGAHFAVNVEVEQVVVVALGQIEAALFVWGLVSLHLSLDFATELRRWVQVKVLERAVGKLTDLVDNVLLLAVVADRGVVPNWVFLEAVLGDLLALECLGYFLEVN